VGGDAHRSRLVGCRAIVVQFNPTVRGGLFQGKGGSAALFYFSWLVEDYYKELIMSGTNFISLTMVSILFESIGITYWCNICGRHYLCIRQLNNSCISLVASVSFFGG
jgi:hypothetical protein